MPRKTLILGILGLVLAISGCVEEQTLEKLTINVCKVDPKNADYWRTQGINLFDKPGGIGEGAKLVGKIPACENVVVDVLEVREVGGVEYYKVKYGDLVGWQTKRLLSGGS